MPRHHVPLAAPTAELAPRAPAGRADEFRTAVTICRTHQRDIGLRHVVVRLDDGPKTTLLFGDSITIDVKPGTHHLRVHNTLFWKNIDFVVETGEHLEFMIINRGGAWTFGLLAWLGASPLFLTVQQRSLA
jgi:hypothetical protein